jgi:hypothetical protein
VEPDDPRRWDGYLRYRKKYPKFPGVKVCVELLERPGTRGDYLESVLGDLADHVKVAGTADVVAAFRTATDERIRAMLLEIVAQKPAPDDLSVLVDALTGAEWMLWFWAARGLHRLGTPEAKRALWEARARPFADPTEGARFRQMLDDLKRGD